MSLTPCKECGKQISNKAASCPSCGHPARQPAAQTTTKRAGSKWEAAGFLLIAGGLVAMIGGNSGPGSTALIIGFVVFIIGRFK